MHNRDFINRFNCNGDKNTPGVKNNPLFLLNDILCPAGTMFHELRHAHEAWLHDGEYKVAKISVERGLMCSRSVRHRPHTQKKHEHTAKRGPAAGRQNTEAPQPLLFSPCSAQNTKALSPWPAPRGAPSHLVTKPKARAGNHMTHTRTRAHTHAQRLEQTSRHYHD